MLAHKAALIAGQVEPKLDEVCEHLLTRRNVLSGLIGGAGLVLGATALPSFAAADVTVERGFGHSRSLTLHNTHTQESVTVEYYALGAYRPDALLKLNHALRDHRTGDVHVMDPALIDLLHTVAWRADHDAEFEVISGYRSPLTNAILHERSSGVASHSLHMEGRAIDIRLVGCDLAKTRDIALGLQVGGVGYYQASQFVHLDTGRVRAWAG